MLSNMVSLFAVVADKGADGGRTTGQEDIKLES